jgi:hypothetical protein
MQLEMMKKNYDNLVKRNEHQFDNMKKGLLDAYRKELEDKNTQIRGLVKERDSFKHTAIEEAKYIVREEIERERKKVYEKDEQLRRAEAEVDKLKKQFSQIQSELKGEVGELQLHNCLREEFKEDLFIPQTIGTPGTDLIQHIRTRSGKLLETTIGYDNKESQTVTKSDIDKAQRDKENQKIGYMIIISRSLPKRDAKNGLLCNKDGIILIHPSILIDFVKIIRSEIIKILKLVTAQSKRDQEVKQERLYRYICSEDFNTWFEKLSEIHGKMFELQNKEEKNHQTLWKTRKELNGQLVDTFYHISSDIENALQERVKQGNDVIHESTEPIDEDTRNGCEQHEY